MKTKRRKLLMTAIAALFLAAFISGCRKDDYVEIDGLCPIVVSTNPTANATNVPFDQIVTVTFNENMNLVTIPQEAFTLQGTTKSSATKSSVAEISGALTYDETNFTMSFTPTTQLTPNTTYTGKVAPTVKDMTGN